MQKLKKLIAVLTVFVLVASVFTMLAMPTEGGIAEENEDDFVKLVEIVDPGALPLDDIDLDSYVGQQGIQFALEVATQDDTSDDNYNITQVWVELETDDEVPISWENHEEIPGDGEGANMTDGTGNETFVFGHEDREDDWYDPEPFEFNVDDNAQPGAYHMGVRIHYSHANETGGIQETHFDTHIDFNINQHVDVEVEEPDRLAPGQRFQEMEVGLDNANETALSEIFLTLDNLPDGVTLREDTAYLPTLAQNGEDSVYYRVDVEKDAEPGIYDDIEYELTAETDDEEYVDIVEEGFLTIEVDFAPIIEASIEDEAESYVEQGTTYLSFNATFENTGNVDLTEIYVTLITEDPYFLESVDHYDYGEGVPPEFHINDLGMDESESIRFEIGLHRNLQDGNHRLRFRWDGYFYNDGSLGDATQWEHVGVDWDDGFLLYDVEEDDNEYNPGAGDTPREDPWIGPEAWLEVHMVDIDFSGEIVAPVEGIELDGEIHNVEIGVNITNHELVAFRDVETQLMVGEETPFFNPVNRTREYVEMEEGPQELDEDGGIATFTFVVDINMDFVSERIGEGAHAYEATVTVTQAVNEDTNEEFRDIDVDATIDLSGYGAELVVEAEISDHDLEAGENFTLSYTIRNVGDETARNTSVSMQPQLYDNDWTIVDGYIRSLASSREAYYEFGQLENRSKDTSHLEMDLLGVEEGEDVVDLHMYIEGSLSSPRPHVWRLYRGEIQPEEEIEVSFNMVASEHTQIGQPYQEDIIVEWRDTNWGRQVREYPTTISLAEAPEEPDEPAEVFGIDAAIFGVILVIIILVIVLAVSLGSRKTGGEEEEEEETFEELEEETEIEEEEEPIEEDELFEETEEPEEPDELEEPLEEEPSDMDEDEEEW